MIEQGRPSGDDRLLPVLHRWISSEPGCSRTLLLAAMAMAFALYAPTIGHDFCLVDDAYFILDNPLVQGGLTWHGIQAAFLTVQATYWAPLLWLSFMLDQELSGGAPWSFHLTNAVLFALSVGLLFTLVRRWTKRTGIALGTALLWAFHPARVESVAWITERKDVLSGLFLLLGLWFYTAGRDAGGRSSADNRPSSCILHPSSLFFLSWLCMLLGGMVKPVVMVMPAALILLDVWPLGRTSWGRLWRDVWRLAAEKWAFWLLAVAFALLAIRLQAVEKAIADIPVLHRLAMIPAHYLFYLQNLVYPTALAPLQSDLLFARWKTGVGLVVLTGATVWLWKYRVAAPWGLWGWLWFVGLLFPFSGVVWVGAESVAMRFLYLPQIGLMLAVALAMAGLAGKHARLGGAVPVLSALVLLVSCVVTLRTLSNWRTKDAFGIWVWENHPEQGGACAIGGDVLLGWGRWSEALQAYQQGVALLSRDCFIRQCMVWNYLGQTALSVDAWDDFERAWGIPLEQFSAWERPSERELFWRVRGQMLMAQGDYNGAIKALQDALRWDPDANVLVMAEYLRACYEGGRPEAAGAVAERMGTAMNITVREWRDLFPAYVEMWKMGARGHAYSYFADYAERFPDDAVTLNYMAWLLATAEPDGLDHARMGEWPQAALRWVDLALKASDKPIAGVWNVMAAARANAGDFSGAVRAAEKARDLARENKDDALAATIEKHIMSYRMGLALRE